MLPVPPARAPPKAKPAPPKTPRKHGFAACSFTVIRLEDEEAVSQLRDDLVALYQPVNSQELFAIKRMALAQLSILRAAHLEASLFTSGMNEALADSRTYLENDLTQNKEVPAEQHLGFYMAEGFRRLCAGKGTDPWRVFLRYQAQAERNYRRALEEFERLKALRNELPNEPITEVEPEENTMPSLAGASAPPSFRAATPDDRVPLDARSEPQPPPSVDSRS